MVRDALAATQWDMRQVNRDASVVAYLDDTYLVGSPSAVIAGTSAFGREMCGLKVHPSKTQVRAPTTPCRDLPMCLQDFWVADLVATQWGLLSRMPTPPSSIS